MFKGNNKQIIDKYRKEMKKQKGVLISKLIMGIFFNIY